MHLHDTGGWQPCRTIVCAQKGRKGDAVRRRQEQCSRGGHTAAGPIRPASAESGHVFRRQRETIVQPASRAGKRHTPRWRCRLLGIRLRRGGLCKVCDSHHAPSRKYRQDQSVPLLCLQRAQQRRLAHGVSLLCRRLGPSAVVHRSAVSSIAVFVTFVSEAVR